MFITTRLHRLLLVFILLSLPSVIFLPATIASQAPQLLTTPPGLELDLKVEKTRFALGEPIILTIVLTNGGKEPFYLSRDLMVVQGHTLDGWPTSLLELEIEDAKGERLSPKGMPISGLIWTVDQTPFDRFLLKTREKYYPGDFRGIRRSLKDLGFELSQPGRYRLRAKYSEPSYQTFVSEKEFDEARKTLKYPWWAKLESEWVSIEIVK
jgi:hypothetical protein